MTLEFLTKSSKKKKENKNKVKILYQGFKNDRIIVTPLGSLKCYILNYLHHDKSNIKHLFSGKYGTVPLQFSQS